MTHEVRGQSAATGTARTTLDVYRVAIELAAMMHEPLRRIRSHNRELEAQARSALRSAVHNIAEGAGKIGSSLREQARCGGQGAELLAEPPPNYAIAQGSTFEVQAALDLCRVWHYLDVQTIHAAEVLLDRLRAMLYRLIARAA